MLQPAGFGLGVTGSSGTLKSSDSPASFGLPDGAIDNGYISRFVEMGYPGLLAFCLALLLAMTASFRSYLVQRKSGNAAAASIVASMIATQVALAFTCIAGDLYSGIGAVVFFLALGLSLMNARGEKVVAEARTPILMRRVRTQPFATRF